MAVAGTFNARNGLEAGHAYTIIDSYRHGNVNLVKMRNPWGNAKYRGRYSNTDNVW